LNDRSKPLRGSHVHILGVAYKRDIDDVRESPALDIIHLLLRRGANVTYSDPFVPSIRLDDSTLASQDAEAFVGSCDCVVIVTIGDARFVLENPTLEGQMPRRSATRDCEGSRVIRLRGGGGECGADC